MDRRVVITGVGVVAPNGIGIAEFWKSLEEGRSGTRRVTAFDASNCRSQVAGEIVGFNPSDFIDKSRVDKMDRYAQLGIAAARMAVQDSSLKEKELAAAGIYIGTGLGGMLWYEYCFERLRDKGPRAVPPSGVPYTMPNSLAGTMAIEFKARGSNITISNACASGLHAMGLAFEAIRNGKLDIALTGGSEASISPLTFAAFDALRVLSSKSNDHPEAACKPFDLNRDGMVLGEASAVVVMESLSSALQRGANLYGEVAGYAANSGAFHVVAPDPTADDIVEVMREAIERAGKKPEDVDYVNAHATGTEANDRIETLGLRRVFGKHLDRVSISGTKSMTGHTIGTAGVLGVLASLLAIGKGVVHPTINYSTPDPACLSNVTPNRAHRRRVGAALVNAFGFGSNNACLLLQGVKS